MYVPYDYQAPIPEKVFTFIKRYPKQHPLVAVPTAGGKTVILSDIVYKALIKWPKVHILVLSHVQEILEQDYEALAFHTGRKVGLYSAGLGKREIEQVTVAGIQSVYRYPERFAKFKFIIIDEAHLIPPGKDTMYRKFFKGLHNAVYLGLTATPFRLGSGYIYGQDDSLFDKLVYDLTSKEKFNKLIDDGYLSNLRTQATSIELDTDNVKTVGGDFDLKGMSRKFDVNSITNAAVKEMIQHGKEYKKWLVFAIDIEHAEHIAEELSANGITTMVVHSKMEFDRATVVKAFKNGVFRCVVNVGMMTTGVNVPDIDLIGLLRPTKSPVIHVQTIGRGLRVVYKEGMPKSTVEERLAAIQAGPKQHCLILDFAGNTERLGPINDIRIYKKGKGKKGGEPITKRCPECDTIHHPSVKVCDSCGFKFEFKTNLKSMPGGLDVIAKRSNGWHKVSDVTYKVYNKPNTPPMLLVTYQCGLRQFKQYVCIEHKGYAGHQGKHWAEFRGVQATTVAELLLKSKDLKSPNRIKVDTDDKYPLVTDFSF